MSDAPLDVWGLGDYAQIAVRLEPAADALVDAAAVQAGQRVLDVGAGTGNVALVAAQRGAHVVACDPSPKMLELGRLRTAGLGVDWVEAGAEDLPFDDGDFDCALSAFGMVFAPDPDRAASELLRVVRPGGAAALTAWVRSGLHHAVFDVLSSHTGPREGHAPDEWGDHETARDRLEPHAAEVSTETRTLHWTFDSIDAWLAHIDDNAPPIVALRGALGDERWRAVRADLRAVIEEHGCTGPGGFTVEPEYLLAVARR